MRLQDGAVPGFFEFRLHFGTQGGEDGFGSFALFKDSDREPFCACTDENVITRDEGLEKHGLGEELAEGVGGLDAFRETLLKHGQADAEDVETRVDDAEAIEAFEKLRHGAYAERLSLLWNDEGVCGGDDVVGDSEKAGGGVYDADIVAA